MSQAVQQQQPHIGLFGGSFDPPHLGHIALVQAGLDLGLDEVWVVPALPVHRTLSGYADGNTRFMWLTRAFANEPRVKILDWEVTQAQPTPAIHSLRRFQHDYPLIIPWLMLGADAWQGLPDWQAYPAHQNLCNVLVFARQNDSAELQPTHHGWRKLSTPSWLNCMKQGHYHKVEVTLPEISATFIRQQLQSGLSLTGLVPKVLQSRIEDQYKNTLKKHKRNNNHDNNKR